MVRTTTVLTGENDRNPNCLHLITAYNIKCTSTLEHKENKKNLFYNKNSSVSVGFFRFDVIPSIGSIE